MNMLKMKLLKLKNQKLDKIGRVQYVTQILFDSCKALGKELNALEQIDYERVNNAKNEYLHAIYKQDGAKTFASEEFKAFMASNEAWLRPYAVFCALRDEHSTPDFNRWARTPRWPC